VTAKRHLDRYRKLQDYGCVPCRMLGFPGTPGDIHHVVDKGYKDNDRTIALCAWHHRGVKPGLVTPDFLGPSLANGSKPFHERFGTEQKMLEEVNKEIACGIY
jgi:hypothetical protein